MLTAYQVETVAYVGDGSIVCRECAISRYGTVAITSLDQGLDEFAPPDVSPLIRYELEEYLSETSWELAAERVDDRLNGRWPELRDELVQREWDSHSNDGYPCDDCGVEIT